MEVVALGVDPSRPGAGLVAEKLEGGGLRFTAAFVGEGGVVTHGCWWVFLVGACVGGGYAGGCWGLCVSLLVVEGLLMRRR